MQPTSHHHLRNFLSCWWLPRGNLWPVQVLAIHLTTELSSVSDVRDGSIRQVDNGLKLDGPVRREGVLYITSRHGVDDMETIFSEEAAEGVRYTGQPTGSAEALAQASNLFRVSSNLFLTDKNPERRPQGSCLPLQSAHIDTARAIMSSRLHLCRCVLHDLHMGLHDTHANANPVDHTLHLCSTRPEMEHGQQHGVNRCVQLSCPSSCGRCILQLQL